jgi:hypothetical protein
MTDMETCSSHHNLNSHRDHWELLRRRLTKIHRLITVRCGEDESTTLNRILGFA